MGTAAEWLVNVFNAKSMANYIFMTLFFLLFLAVLADSVPSDHEDDYDDSYMEGQEYEEREEEEEEDTAYEGDKYGDVNGSSDQDLNSVNGNGVEIDDKDGDEDEFGEYYADKK
uniref:Uncharacterized protein n=1 Tax=Romanomermis culicivorax TaxID=13658 RepID=A0A915KX82_ROMCU